jgi:hypothetical protein
MSWQIMTVLTSTCPTDAGRPATMLTVTSARFVAMHLTIMELRDALAARELKPCTPYIADTWEQLLAESSLACIYPEIVPGLCFGFHASVPPIQNSFFPKNAPSLAEDPHFIAVIQSELCLGRWISPVSIKTAQCVFGPIQTSPCSIIPKPRNPEKKHLIQNFSFPCICHDSISSINSSIDITNFPCTCGTLWVVAIHIDSLPPGSQIAIWDMQSTYWTILLHPSQWPGTAILVDINTIVFNICGTFGFKPSGGLLRKIADVLCELI